LWCRMLFDWLYGNHITAIVACLEAWADTPAVTTPLLKFMVEFVSNKGQCMVFDTSSPNGILIFREISKMLVIFCNATLQVPPRMHMHAYTCHSLKYPFDSC
jgi:exportin-7